MSWMTTSPRMLHKALLTFRKTEMVLTRKWAILKRCLVSDTSDEETAIKTSNRECRTAILRVRTPDRLDAFIMICLQSATLECPLHAMESFPRSSDSFLSWTSFGTMFNQFITTE
jgi:hypothetical protein